MTPSEARKVLESKDFKGSLEHVFAIQKTFADLCFSNNDIKGPEGEILNCDRIAQDALSGKHGYNHLLVPWMWEMVDAIDDELREIRELLPWKHWSKSQLGEKKNPGLPWQVQLNHLRLELVDIIHFLVEALIFSGMTSEEVYQLYLQKNLANIERQEKAYNDAHKTEEDNEKIASSFK